MEPYVMIIIWACVVISSVIFEIESVSLTSIWFAAAGLISLILAAFDVIWWIQVLVFVVLSFALLFACRPFLRKVMNKNKVAHTNADRVFEKFGYVTKEIPVGEIGEVKIDNDTWRAISETKEVIEVGTKVKINSFEGNKVNVSKFEE